MYSFDYHKAQSLDDAKARFDGADDALYLAGGMTLIPTLKQRLSMPSELVDISHIDGLKGISVDGNDLVIGAMTTHADVSAHALTRVNIPALSYLTSLIGDPQVRNRGTLGGSLANNDPSSDYPAAVLALGATIVTDRRAIAADDFFVDLFETALNEGEIITSVRFPIPTRAGYAKFANPASRYAVVGVFVADMAGDMRVAVTGAAVTAFRQTEMEQALAASFAADSVATIKNTAEGLNNDPHASAQYRASLITTMAERAVQNALQL